MGLLMVPSSSPFLAKLVQRQRWQRAIAAIVMGRSVTAAARDAGVNRRSLYDWLKQPEFCAELQAALAKQAERTQDSLDGVGFAVETYVTDILSSAGLTLNKSASAHYKESRSCTMRLGIAWIAGSPSRNATLLRTQHLALSRNRSYNN
jgi:hypothetical protein